MQVIECHGHGGPDVLRRAERPVPQPAAGEVLIRVAAAGVNRPDLLQRAGKYPPPAGASDIPGLEVAGEIAALGAGVTRWRTGDKVCALLAGGGYADFATTPEGQCLPVPDGLSLIEAAALPETIFTVWANLFESGDLQAGAAVLVHGGSGGIGTMAIQMAKAAGACVFVTAGSAAKLEACCRLGADCAINYHEEDFAAVIARETDGQGVDIVLDSVGGAYVPRNLEALAPFGRHISIATQAGRMTTIDLRLVMQQRLTLTGSTLRVRPAAEKARLAREIETKVWPWIAAGKVKPLIYQTFALKDAAEAHKMMESGAHIGKIVLEVGAG